MPFYTLRLDKYAAILTFLWISFFIYTLAECLRLCQGHLIYALDDPYIHLTFASRLLQGTFGINQGELASPGSSLLWPWLMALTEIGKLGVWGPLIANIPIALCSVYLGGVLLKKINAVEPLTRSPYAYALGLTMIFAMNAVALPFTGMEHLLHILLLLVILLEMLKVARGAGPSRVLGVCLVLLPLVRLEGLAYAGTAFLVLWLRGYRKQSLAYAAGLTALLGIYAGVMLHLKLPIIPGSILLKSDFASSAVQGDGISYALLNHFLGSLAHPSGQMLLACGFIMLCMLIHQRHNRAMLFIVLPVFAAVVAHIFAGHYGFFFRYEDYAMTLAFFGIQICRDNREDVAQHQGSALLSCLLLVMSVFIAAPYAKAALLTPLAARNNYEQQYQMRRFVFDFFPEPIAVNDLGLVSFGNDNYVLDLWGLGSEEIRKLKMANAYDSKAMERIIKEHNIQLIMIYESWYRDQIPASWVKLAVLHTRERIVVAQQDVAFFAPSATQTDALKQALVRFKKTLPREIGLQLFFDPSGFE